MKSLLVPILLFTSIYSAHAIDCEGYIIKPTGDTIRGKVDVPVSKGKVKEILFAEMWTEMKFAEGTSKSKKIKAGEVSGFGFEFGGNWYHYELLDLQKNSKQKESKFMEKVLGKFVNDFNFFLLRIQDGALPVYREYWPSESERKMESGGRKITIYNQEVNVETWIKNAEGTYIDMAPTTLGGNKKLKKFLKDYIKLEDAFLNTIDDKSKFDDAEDILAKYNEWKKSH